MESYQRENKLKRIPIILCGWVSVCFFLQFSPLHLMLHEKALLLLYNLEDGYFKLCTLCSTFVVIGMEASGGMFTSFLGRRDLYHHMMMPINIVMQMLTRFVAFKLQFYFTILVPWYLLGHSFPKQIKLINYYIFYVYFFFNVLQWVSHRNHRGNICGVDFIWLCNPNKSRKPLRTSWAEAVFSIIKVSNIYYLVKYSYFFTSH